jgi:NAD-dependent deacetylase
MSNERLMARVPPQLIETLRQSREVTVLTGSGISAESGIPTFRDAQTGIWAEFRPEDLATPEAFASNPRRVWDWYAWRREMVSEAQPNPGHGALARMARTLSGFNLVTQNVDGLHQRAGSKDVIEYHGNIMRDKCSIEDVVVEHPAPGDEVPPRCPACGGMLRPDVVWFGEAIPAAALESAQRAAERCDVFLSIGTSSLVYPAAGLMEVALRNGATLVEINPAQTPVTKLAEFALTGTAGAILPQLSAALLEPV